MGVLRAFAFRLGVICLRYRTHVLSLIVVHLFKYLYKVVADMHYAQEEMHEKNKLSPSTNAVSPT